MACHSPLLKTNKQVTHIHIWVDVCCTVRKIWCAQDRIVPSYMRATHMNWYCTHVLNTCAILVEYYSKCSMYIILCRLILRVCQYMDSVWPLWSFWAFGKYMYLVKSNYCIPPNTELVNNFSATQVASLCSCWVRPAHIWGYYQLKFYCLFCEAAGSRIRYILEWFAVNAW